MHGKAFRRANKRRMKRKAVVVYGYKEAIKYADNLCACSCFMCAMDRKYHGATIQERRQVVHL